MTSPSQERAFDRACEAALAAFVEESGGFGEEDDRKLMLLVVRAVLQAIREPDDDALAAGIAQANECTDDGTASAACIPEHCFSAMVDAILQQGAEPKQVPVVGKVSGDGVVHYEGE